VWTPWRIAAILVCGAIGGILGDQIHVQLGVLWYPHPEPGILGQSWWVGPLFAGSTLVMLAVAVPFARAARPRAQEPFLNPFVTGTSWLAGAYLASGLFFRHSRALAAVYLLAWVARVAPRRDRVAQITLGLILAAGGAATEIVLSRAGLFYYRLPDWVVPIWLPGLYLHGAPLAIALADWLDRRGNARASRAAA
jgi:hypothetical protein